MTPRYYSEEEQPCKEILLFEPQMVASDDDDDSLSEVSLLDILETKSSEAPLSRVIEMLEQDCNDDKQDPTTTVDLFGKNYAFVTYTGKNRHRFMLSLAAKFLLVWCVYAVWSAACRPDPTNLIVKDSLTIGGDALSQRQEQQFPRTSLAAQPTAAGTAVSLPAAEQANGLALRSSSLRLLSTPTNNLVNSGYVVSNINSSFEGVSNQLHDQQWQPRPRVQHFESKSDVVTGGELHRIIGNTERKN